MGFISRILPFSSFWPFWRSAGIQEPLSKLALFYRLAERALQQHAARDGLGERHYVSLLNNGSLELKSLEGSPNTSTLNKVKKGVADFLMRSRKKEGDLDLHSSAWRRQNQRTWEFFKSAVIEQVGREQLDWVCRRYQLPVKLLEEGDPLLIHHIKIFYIGLSQFNREWIEKKHLEIGALSRLTRTKLTAVLRDWHKQITMFAPEEARRSSLLALSPRPQRASLFGVGALHHGERTAVGTLWGQALQIQGIPHDRIHHLSSKRSPLTTHFVPWLEEFCKDTVNRELVDGQLIPVPGEDRKEDWYQVYAKIAARGLIAYALIPVATDSCLKPLIVFRPTQRELAAEDALGTFQNDVELKIGSSGWLAAREALEKLMVDPQFRKKGAKVIVAGYSIGGAYVQYFLYQFSNAVTQAFSFNAPSIDAETARAFAQKVNNTLFRKGEGLSLFVVRSLDDHISKFGERHVGHGVVPRKGVHVELVEVKLKEKMGWQQQHTARAFGGRPCQMTSFSSREDLMVKLDNSKRGADVEWYQHLHHRWGWLAFNLFQFLDRLISFFRRVMGTSNNSSTLQYKWK